MLSLRSDFPTTETMPMTMNEYEARQERRRERYEEIAAKNEAASRAAFERSRAATAGIPMGQPILVGHHSEKRHRAALARSDNAMRANIEAADKAAYYRGKADGVGRAGVSSDDPEALDKLREKLAKRERLQERMKAANKVVKSKKLDDAGRIAALIEQGIPESAAAELLEPDFAGRIGFASYQLTNNNAQIRRLKGRIEALEREHEQRQRVAAALEAEGRNDPAPNRFEGNGLAIEIEEAHDDNRIRLHFNGKPPAEVRAVVKRAGFRWSRYAGAWQRHLNNAGRYAAESTARQLTGSDA